MNITELKVIKSDERGIMYDCDKLNYLERKKGSVSADHSHKDREILYLIKGKAVLTVDDETKAIKAPARIEIEPNVYHKLEAATDIILLEDREFE